MSDGRRKLKYLDKERFQIEALSDAKQLGLDKSDPLTILDIGTGPGYFPLACQAYGHSTYCADKPGEFFEGIRRENNIATVFEHFIEPMVPFPRIEMRFDLITSFRVPFNAVKDESRLWSLDEWEFFLDDVRDSLLKPGGRLAIKLQKKFNYPGLQYGSLLLMDLFYQRGAVDNQRIFDFDPLW